MTAGKQLMNRFSFFTEPEPGQGVTAENETRSTLSDPQENDTEVTALADTSEITKCLSALDAEQKKGLLTCARVISGNPELATQNPRYLIESLIAETDIKIGEEINLIIHHPDFLEIEGIWRGLYYLVTSTNTSANLKIRVFNISKKLLGKTLKKFRGTSWDQSPIFKKLYEDEYGTAGGEPLGVIIGDYYFNHSAPDLELLKGISQIAAAAHSPFISAADPSVMNLDSWSELANPRGISKIFSTPEYASWTSFRNSDDSRYVALTLPRILARLPYGPDSNHIEGLNFIEDTTGNASLNHVWMNSAYAMGININRAFEKYGWCAKIRGIKSGGLVDHLSKFIGLTGNPAENMEVPVEIAISDHREAEISSCGFIPLCFCKNTDYAVFLGSQTVNSPRVYDNPNASANAQLSSRLPYLFAVSRFAHYVKCIVRDKLGSFESKEDMTKWLSDWSSEYVTTDPNADEDIKARYPLAEAKVSIDDIENQPGYYNVKFYLKPHYQLEGLTTTLCLTTKVPRPASQ